MEHENGPFHERSMHRWPPIQRLNINGSIGCDENKPFAVVVDSTDKLHIVTLCCYFFRLCRWRLVRESERRAKYNEVMCNACLYWLHQPQTTAVGDKSESNDNHNSNNNINDSRQIINVSDKTASWSRCAKRSLDGKMRSFVEWMDYSSGELCLTVPD